MRLTCEVIISYNPVLLLVGAYEEHVYKTKLQTREKLLQKIIEYTDCMKEMVKLTSMATISFSDRQHCTY
jgi:hypothetical protein